MMRTGFGAVPATTTDAGVPQGGYAATDETLLYGTVGFKPWQIAAVGAGAALVAGLLGFWVGRRR